MTETRPVDHTPRHTADLPATPVRDRTIPASAWVEAPERLLTLGADLPADPDTPADPDAPASDGTAVYRRRIGRWLLWRAGPATGGHARYLAVDPEAVDRRHEFRLWPDGSGDGIGPSGRRHERFRSWKEDLRDND